MVAKKKPASAPPAKQTVTVDVRKNETDNQARARVAVSPTFNAAVLERRVIKRIVGGDELSVTDVRMALLERLIPVVRDGDMSSVESMLFIQANTLDMMFNDFALRATASDTMPKLEAYMRLALKAQQQSASTLRVLGELKAPKQVAFIKQANVAHGPQQVNNGVAPPAESRTENSTGMTNELLGESHGETLDAGTAGQAGRSNQELETVGAVHRAAD